MSFIHTSNIYTLTDQKKVHPATNLDIYITENPLHMESTA